MKTFNVRTAQHCELVDITRQVQRCVDESGAKNGIAIVFVPHTTAGVSINENADPDVKRDVLFALARTVRGPVFYTPKEIRMRTPKPI